MKRAFALALAVTVSLVACAPPRPPPTLERFIGVRMPRSGGAPAIAFGRCNGELILEVSLRLADPPAGAGILWQIRSPGAARSRFIVGVVPQGFESIVPLAGRLPSQFLVVEVRTDNARWPTTTTSFRVDELEPARFSSDAFGEVTRSQIGEFSRRGCVPRQGFYM